MLKNSGKWLQPDFLAWFFPAAASLPYTLPTLDFIILFIDTMNDFLSTNYLPNTLDTQHQIRMAMISVFSVPIPSPGEGKT